MAVWRICLKWGSRAIRSRCGNPVCTPAALWARYLTLFSSFWLCIENVHFSVIKLVFLSSRVFWACSSGSMPPPPRDSLKQGTEDSTLHATFKALHSIYLAFSCQTIRPPRQCPQDLVLSETNSWWGQLPAHSFQLGLSTVCSSRLDLVRCQHWRWKSRVLWRGWEWWDASFLSIGGKSTEVQEQLLINRFSGGTWAVGMSKDGDSLGILSRNAEA